MFTKLAALLAASFILGCASSRPLPPPPATAAKPTPDERHVYRLEFIVATTDPGKPATSTRCTMNLEELNHGEIHLGANVPISNQARADVGLKISAAVIPAGTDDVLLRDGVEVSSFEDGTSPATIHKVQTNGDAFLRAGQPALVASLEDPVSHKRYEVTATATVLR